MKKAFTLIELLVVVLIIGILSAIALPQYTKAVERARAAEAITNIRTIVNNVEMTILETGVKDNNGIYANPENWSIELSGGKWVNGAGPTYVTKYFYYVPMDDMTCVSAYRCKGTCSEDIDDNEPEYELVESYPSINGGPDSGCNDYTEFGRSMCKALGY